MEKITQEELNNIDLDIYSLMKKIPNNKNYNSLYIRWEKDSGNSFRRILCNPEDLAGLLNIVLYDEDLITDKAKEIIEPAKIAFLNIALNILKDKAKEEVDYFLNVLKEIRKQ